MPLYRSDVLKNSSEKGYDWAARHTPHLTPDAERIGWTVANILTGALAIMVAWKTG
jgi:hypothetical protein